MLHHQHMVWLSHLMHTLKPNGTKRGNGPQVVLAYIGLQLHHIIPMGEGVSTCGYEARRTLALALKFLEDIDANRSSSHMPQR